MKILNIFVIFALSVIVVNAWITAAVRGIEPVILSFGAAFAAFQASEVDLDNHTSHLFLPTWVYEALGKAAWKKWRRRRGYGEKVTS